MEIALFSEFTLSQSKGKFRNDRIGMSLVVIAKQSHTQPEYAIARGLIREVAAIDRKLYSIDNSHFIVT